MGRLGVVGVWIWGGATALLGLAIVLIVATGLPAELYTRVKDTSGALAGVIAASALAWSIFFQTSGKDEQATKIDALLQRADAILRAQQELARPSVPPSPPGP
jgi:hypothetical protein